MGNEESTQQNNKTCNTSSDDERTIQRISLPLQWSELPNGGHVATYANRLAAYLFIRNNTTTICSNLWTNDQINQRIGTESTAGEVYELKYQNYMIAAKLMPIDTISSEHDNQNEINMARLFSDAVVHRECSHFPLLYGSGYCKNTMKGSQSWSRGLDFQIRMRVVDQLSSVDRKRLLIQSRSMNTAQFLANAHQLGLMTPDPNHFNVQSNVMFSEMAYSDMKILFNMEAAQALNLYDYCDDYVRQVLVAIQYMKSKNVMHNDLHLGNVLLLPILDERRMIALVHDFGKSAFVSEWKCDDVVKFFDDLSHVPFLKSTIKMKIQAILKYTGPSRLEYATNMFSYITTQEDGNDEEQENDDDD